MMLEIQHQRGYYDDKSLSSSSKATHIRTSADPDVTLVIGGTTTYLEYSQNLRTWSGYFDRALSSGMQEEDTLKFEFPDKDPKEWEWIVSLMAPMTEERVTLAKLSVALDWFDFLCSNIGLKACDKILSHHLASTGPATALTTNDAIVKDSSFARSICQCGRIHSHHFPSAVLSSSTTISSSTNNTARTSDSSNNKRNNSSDVVTAEQLALVMKHLGMVVQYNLEASKVVCFKTVRVALVKHATLLTKDTLEIITALVKDTVECRSQFLGPLKTHLPASISEDQADMLLANDMLHEMIFLQIDRIKQQEQQRCAQKRMVDIMEKQRRVDLTLTKRDFKRDSIWGSLVPDRWA